MGILKVTHSYSVLTVGASQIDKCSQLQGEIHGIICFSVVPHDAGLASSFSRWGWG